jgi:hypothetical protein
VGAGAEEPPEAAAVPAAGAPATGTGRNRIFTKGEIIPIEMPLRRAKTTMSAAVRARCPR